MGIQCNDELNRTELTVLTDTVRGGLKYIGIKQQKQIKIMSNMKLGIFSIILDFVISDVTFVEHSKFKLDGEADIATMRDCYLYVIS